MTSLEQAKKLKEAPSMEKASELRELKDLLVSARAIAQRLGKDTNWEAFDKRIASFGIGSVTAKVFRLPPTEEEFVEKVKETVKNAIAKREAEEMEKWVDVVRTGDESDMDVIIERLNRIGRIINNEKEN